MEAQLPNLSGVVDIDPMWRSTMAAARAYLRDYAKLNILLEEEETDDKTLLLCLQMTVVDVNSTPLPPRGRCAACSTAATSPSSSSA